MFMLNKISDSESESESETLLVQNCAAIIKPPK